MLTPPDGQWGGPLPDGNVSGIIGQVARREAHLAICEITITGDSQVVWLAWKGREGRERKGRVWKRRIREGEGKEREGRGRKENGGERRHDGTRVYQHNLI